MFKKEDIESIDRKYFTVIVANEYDITLVSNNTHHVWYMASGDNKLKKCANPNCGKFFTPNPGRNDKIYCSHTCGINVAKRRQRMRDKENPNRERLEPGFRNR